MRKSTHVVIFLVMLNAASGLVISSGLAADMGLIPQTGGSEQLGSVNNKGFVEDVQPGGGAGGTLFGLFTSVGGVARDILMVIFAGPIMFETLGIPTFLAVFLFAPAPILVATDILYIFSGRDI